MTFRLIVSDHHDGRRLDRLLRTIWPAVPLGNIMRSLRTGAVRLDGRKADAASRVAAGQEIIVPWEAPDERPPIPQYAAALCLDVLYRDESVWVVNKPVDLLVQPDVKDGDSVLRRVEAMRAALPRESADAPFPPAAVHRLDRNTTGVLIVAVSGRAQRELERVFRERLLDKTYLAIVSGSPQGEGSVTASLLKDPETNTVRVDPTGQNACTRYRTLERSGGLALVEIELVTGRTHQARVHMAHIGCPILGDRKYGFHDVNNDWKKRGAKRPLLHAWKIFLGELRPPVDHLSGMTFTAPVPDDMKKLLRETGFREV